MLLPDPLGPTITTGKGFPLSSNSGLTWHFEMGPVFPNKVLRDTYTSFYKSIDSVMI